MLEYSIDDKYLLPKTGSLGTQTKYFKDNYFYKINKVGNESVSERLCTLLLDCTDLHHVKYEECRINNKLGCRSKNFKRGSESLITLETLHILNESSNFDTAIRTFRTVKERYNYTLKFIKEVTGLDATEYLDGLICLDFITLNPDRHAGNIAFIKDERNKWSCAPIFDNGQSLGANWSITPPGEFKESRISSNFLSGSFSEQLTAVTKLIRINYTALYYMLESERNTRNKTILLDRLKINESLFKYI